MKQKIVFVRILGIPVVHDGVEVKVLSLIEYCGNIQIDTQCGVDVKVPDCWMVLIETLLMYPIGMKIFICNKSYDGTWNYDNNASA